MKKVKLIKPKSWEELEAEADKAGGEWIAVDGKDLPPLIFCGIPDCFNSVSLFSLNEN